MRMLLSNVRTDGVQRSGGHNHCAEGMKCAVALEQLLGEPDAVIEQLFELVWVNGECGHAMMANEPAQAGRATDVQLPSEARTRPCLQPDGSAKGLFQNLSS